jgi:hypothetical protein
MNVQDQNTIVVRINAPEWFEDAGFVRWLDSPGSATWHPKGQEVGEGDDAFFTYCQGEGSDYPDLPESPGIPEHIWEQVVKLVTELHGDYAEVLVWVSNLPE